MKSFYLSLVDPKLSKPTVRMGVNDLKEASEVTMKADRVVIHPKYISL